jgi:serine/threonine protein kinase
MSIKSAVFKFVDSEFGKISDHARDFINKLLRAKPGDRLTATDALAHPFLAAPSGDTVLELVAEQITL